MSDLHQSGKTFRCVGHWNQVGRLIGQILESMNSRQPLRRIAGLSNADTKSSQQSLRGGQLLSAGFVLGNVLQGETCMETRLVALRKGGLYQHRHDLSHFKDNKFSIATMAGHVGKQLYRVLMGWTIMKFGDFDQSVDQELVPDKNVLLSERGIVVSGMTQMARKNAYLLKPLTALSFSLTK